jgi:hypothetical protein
MRAATLLSSGGRSLASCLRRPASPMPQACSTSGRGSSGASRALRCGPSSSQGSSRRAGVQRQPLQLYAAAAVDAIKRTNGAAPPRSDVITSHPSNNVTDYIYSKMGASLHTQPAHPIGIIKQAIYDYFEVGPAASARERWCISHVHVQGHGAGVSRLPPAASPSLQPASILPPAPRSAVPAACCRPSTRVCSATTTICTRW